MDRTKECLHLNYFEQQSSHFVLHCERFCHAWLQGSRCVFETDKKRKCLTTQCNWILCQDWRTLAYQTRSSETNLWSAMWKEFLDCFVGLHVHNCVAQGHARVISVRDLKISCLCESQQTMFSANQCEYTFLWNNLCFLISFLIPNPSLTRSKFSSLRSQRSARNWGQMMNSFVWKNWQLLRLLLIHFLAWFREIYQC